jgi:hypothetical protein
VNPPPIPPMVQPSLWTTVVFVAIVLALAAALVTAVARARVDGESPARHRRWVIGTAAGLFVWLAITAAIAESGVLEKQTLPPRVMLLIFSCVLVAAVAALSPLGTRLVRNVSIAALIGFQVFRLPLEIVLHQWWKEGVLPIQMTFEGRNFDIASGILALIVGLWGARRPLPRPAIVLFNLSGVGLLIAVGIIAILSTPIPIRRFMNDPPVLLAFHAPYVWIVPFCVGGALFGHVLVFRRLLADLRAARASR